MFGKQILFTDDSSMVFITNFHHFGYLGINYIPLIFILLSTIQNGRPFGRFALQDTLMDTNNN